MSDSHSITSVEYREIPDAPGYRFGSDGMIWSSWICGNRARPDGRSWHLIKQKPHKLHGHFNGYLVVKIRYRGKASRVKYVHSLILTAFAGPRPAGMETRHLNGIKTDNRAENLAWGTPLENKEDQVRHGVWQRGERSGLAKLTEAKVHEIRRRYRQGGCTHRELGIAFGVTEPTIQAVLNGRTWNHVTE